jgi:hypothetical protein
MRQFFAALAAALAALGTLVATLVFEGGRWVTRLFREPATSMPPPAPLPVDEPSAQEEYAGVRRVAGLLAAGMAPQPADLQGMPPLVARWLRLLDRPSLIRVAAASDDAIREHLRDRLRIKGWVPADVDSIAALEQANRPRVPTRPTLRQLLEARAAAA